MKALKNAAIWLLIIFGAFVAVTTVVGFIAGPGWFAACKIWGGILGFDTSGTKCYWL